MTIPPCRPSTKSLTPTPGMMYEVHLLIGPVAAVTGLNYDETEKQSMCARTHPARNIPVVKQRAKNIIPG